MNLFSYIFLIVIFVSLISCGQKDSSSYKFVYDKNGKLTEKIYYQDGKVVRKRKYFENGVIECIMYPNPRAGFSSNVIGL